MRKLILLYTTFCIYFITILVHLFLYQLENGRSFLGMTMMIPLLAVILIQKILLKQQIVHTFSFTKPKWNWLLISIIVPIILGFSYHTYIHLTSHEIYLYSNLYEFVQLLLIGLSISSISALLEEVVWRGNFHYYFRKHYGMWATACITGVIWSIWHLPIALLYKSFTKPAVSTLIYLLLLFVLSLVLSIIRENGKSIFPVALLHGMMNVFYLSEGNQMSVSTDVQEGLKFIGLMLILIVCILLTRHKSVTILKNK